MTHTPGPWKADEYTKGGGLGDHQVVSPEGAIVAFCPTGYPFANARLIAAAPDLLAALKKIEVIGRGARPNISKGAIAGDIAREAIATAEGSE